MAEAALGLVNVQPALAIGNRAMPDELLALEDFKGVSAGSWEKEEALRPTGREPAA